MNAKQHRADLAYLAAKDAAEVDAAHDRLRRIARNNAEMCGYSYREVLRLMVKDPSYEVDETGLRRDVIIAWAQRELAK